MEILGEMPGNSGTVTALGVFDGVHIGHAELLRETVRLAALFNRRPAVFTFDSSKPYKDGGCLLSEEDKEAAFFSLGIQTVFRVPFSEVADLSPADFINKVLKDGCHAGAAVVGSNFRFGKDAAGRATDLSHLLPTRILPPVLCGGAPVSSTRVRRAVTSGHMEKVTEMLGRPFSYKGEILRGKGLGKQIGFPTVNLAFPQGRVLPRFGVYASEVTVDGVTYSALTNVGVRPSVERNGVPNSESFLFRAEGDLYEKTAEVRLLHFVRPERKFESLEELTKQIQIDKKEVSLWMLKYILN